MPYTNHGHWHSEAPVMKTMYQVPRLVARCGGPGLCVACSQEVAAYALRSDQSHGDEHDADVFRMGWEAGQEAARKERASRPCGPKTADHPSVGQECPACHVPFVEGDWTCLIILGPADDEESQALAREGMAYNAVAIETHLACATGYKVPLDMDVDANTQASQD